MFHSLEVLHLCFTTILVSEILGHSYHTMFRKAWSGHLTFLNDYTTCQVLFFVHFYLAKFWSLPYRDCKKIRISSFLVLYQNSIQTCWSKSLGLTREISSLIISSFMLKFYSPGNYLLRWYLPDYQPLSVFWLLLDDILGVLSVFSQHAWFDPWVNQFQYSHRSSLSSQHIGSIQIL